VQQFLQVTFSGIATGAIFAIAAVGFALLWQTAGAINFAHGDFIMLPAVIMLVVGLHEPTLGIPDFVPGIGGANIGVVIPTVGIIAGFAIAIPIAILLLGWVFKVSIVDRLLKPGGDDIPLVIATIGLGLFAREYVHETFGATPQNFPSAFGNTVWRPGGIAITRNDVGVLVVAVIVILALQLFLNRTYTGRQMEAAAQNAEAATVLGIPVKRMILFTFAINAVLCTVAALLVTPTVNARWDGGLTLGLLAFTAAIIGGFNQVRGALFGGFLVGVLQNWSGTYLSSAYREAIPLLLLIIVILWRPQGLFGRAEERRI
jgi:branched-chain amino acid transport system permease protein